MGSHIFKVDELCLNIDKEFMQEVCERVGYIPDPSIWNPPDDSVDFPELDGVDEEIQLLYSVYDDFVIDFQIAAGTYKMLVYGNDNTLISSEDISGGRTQRTLSYDDGHPSSDDAVTFRVLFQAIATSITNFRLYSNAPGLIAAYMNTPYLTQITQAFNINYTLEFFKYFSKMENLTTMNASFTNSPKLISILFPDVPNLETQIDAFSHCPSAKKIIFTNNEFPYLTSMEKLIHNTPSSKGVLEEIVLPKSLPLCDNFDNAFSYNNSLRKITFPDFVKPDVPISLNSSFRACPLLEEIIFPQNVKEASSAHSTFYDCTALKKLNLYFPIAGNSTFRGCESIRELNITLSDDTTNITSMFHGMISLKKLIILNEESDVEILANLCNGNTVLTELKLPEKLKSATNIGALTQGCANLTEMDEVEWPVTPIPAGNAFTTAMYIVNQPTLRVTHFSLHAVSQKNTTHINIDWANSNFNTLTTAIAINGVQLDVTEINRIFTALPAVSNNRNINVRLNPGAAACDATIATAKGWTVTK